MSKAKDYMERLKIQRATVNGKLDQVQNLYDMAQKVTQTFRDGPKGSRSSHGIMEDSVARITDLQMEISRDVEVLTDMIRTVQKGLDALDRWDQVQVIQLRYLQGMTWEETADAMGMTSRNVCYIHGRALKALDATAIFP